MSDSLIVQERQGIAAHPSHQFQWRNRYVTKDGKGHRACKAWPTQEKAAERAAHWEERASNERDTLLMETLDGVISAADLHYVMPMPELV